ncbi:MAG TPA: hypothetical protein VM843_00330 [Flavisolibacter sp.]|jgi:hemerythrin-like domain-containing protein|nr:hypothetical protein [Flavisolibacter sp.]
MPDDNPPIKRSIELTPLSREHHEGLLFSWKIKQGLDKHIETSRISNFVSWFWKEELCQHFDKEEEVLLSFLGKKMTLKERLLEEHALIRHLVHDAEVSPTPALLLKLSEVVHDHIRFEERVLFKHLEVSLTAEELGQIGQQLLETTKVHSDWPDPFWLRGHK